MTMFYRYQDTLYSEERVMLVKSSFPVLSTTPTGVWLDVYGAKRFVKLDARKRFACPTEAEALESFHARKRRQIRLLKHQLRRAETALTLTEDREGSFAYFIREEGL